MVKELAFGQNESVGFLWEVGGADGIYGHVEEV